MKCPRCQNTDESLFYYDKGGWYCRRCIAFGKQYVHQTVPEKMYSQNRYDLQPVLEFELTPYQKQVSRQALSILQSGRDVFIYAAAGAGKTEITLESICYYLSQSRKVGFAISRRQVVLEIAKRLSKNFPTLKVVPVCSGHTEITDGDLIVCTTHQLYRYPQCFDLLILDELDAFPYAGNEMLEALAQNSCRGRKMLLSATPDKKSLAEIQKGKMEMVQLFQRPHRKPLCVPFVRCHSNWISILCIVIQCTKLIRRGKQVLVFVPRKIDGWLLQKILCVFHPCELIHSSSHGKDEIMDRFRNKERKVLVCTTLLERGITVPSVQVLVYRADHRVFTTASLIQIFGRIGRTFQDPEGVGICYCSRPSDSLKECIRQLKWMNQNADGVLHNSANPSL